MGASAAASASKQLLKSKRPLGRRQLGSDVANWLREELGLKADEYLENVKDAKLWKNNEDATFAQKQEVLTGQAMFATFSPQSLSEHLEQRLDEKSPSSREVFELAAQHRPTIWTTFQLVVQTKLQRGGRDGADELAWQDTAEWRIFGHLQRQASPRKGSAAKPLDTGVASQAKLEPKQRRQGAAQKQRKPASDEEAQRDETLRPKPPRRAAAAQGAPRAEGSSRGAASSGQGGNEPWRGGATLEKRGAAGRSAAAESRTSRLARRREARVAAARARDAARRTTLVRPLHQPYGKRAIGKAATAWLLEASEACAREYMQIVQGARAEQLSGLVDVLGSGAAGTNAIMLALNTAAVSAETVTQAAKLLGGEDVASAAEATSQAGADSEESVGAVAAGPEARDDSGEAAEAAEATGMEAGEVAEFERLQYERMLQTIRPVFAPLPLVQRCNALLDEMGSPQPPSAEGAAGVDLRGHVPTIWSFFTRSVRVQLQAQLGERWSSSAEWRALLALYAEYGGSGAPKGARWQLGKSSRWRRPPQPDNRLRRVARRRRRVSAYGEGAAIDDSALQTIGSWSRRSRGSSGAAVAAAGSEGKVVPRRQRVHRAPPVTQ